MMRISTALWYRQGVNSMLDNQSALSKTQLQLATGRRMLAPSDDPTAAIRTLELKGQLARVSQYQRNAGVAEARLRREEEVLGGMADTLQRVRELAVQGLNDSNSPDDRQAIALEIRQHLDALLSLANETDANGEHLFGGYQGETPPFVEDGSGGYRYQGDQGQRLLQISDSRHVAINDPGDRLFMGIDDAGGGTTDLFSIVRKLADDLDADAPEGITLSQLDNALERIDLGRASIGGRLNAIENQNEMHRSFSLVMEEDRSLLEDLDYAEAVSRLQQQTMALQASQQTFTRIEGLSLFNYL